MIASLTDFQRYYRLLMKEAQQAVANYSPLLHAG